MPQTNETGATDFSVLLCAVTQTMLQLTKGGSY